MLEKALSREYWKGVEDGMRRYAWWKDGVQYVGIGLDTLKQAIRFMDKDAKQNCPHVEFYDVDGLPYCARCGTAKPVLDGGYQSPRSSDNATTPIDPAGERATNRLHAALRQHRADLVNSLHNANHEIQKWRALEDKGAFPEISKFCEKALTLAAVIDLFDVLLRENRIGADWDEWNR